MKNKLVFRILGALASALIIASVFIPFVSVTGFSKSLWESNSSVGTIYLPILIIVFGVIGVILFATNIKTEFAYMGTGALIFFLVVQTVPVIEQGTFNTLGVGYFCLVVGTILTGVMAFLCGLKSKKVLVNATAPVEKEVSLLDKIDNLYSEQPVEQNNQVNSFNNTIQPIPVENNIQPIENNVQGNIQPIPEFDNMQSNVQSVPVENNTPSIPLENINQTQVVQNVVQSTSMQDNIQNTAQPIPVENNIQGNIQPIPDFDPNNSSNFMEFNKPIMDTQINDNTVVQSQNMVVNQFTQPTNVEGEDEKINPVIEEFSQSIGNHGFINNTIQQQDTNQKNDSNNSNLDIFG